MNITFEVLFTLFRAFGLLKQKQKCWIWKYHPLSSLPCWFAKWFWCRMTIVTLTNHQHKLNYFAGTCHEVRFRASGSPPDSNNSWHICMGTQTYGSIIIFVSTSKYENQQFWYWLYKLWFPFCLGWFGIFLQVGMCHVSVL